MTSEGGMQGVLGEPGMLPPPQTGDGGMADKLSEGLIEETGFGKGRGSSSADDGGMSKRERKYLFLEERVWWW